MRDSRLSCAWLFLALGIVVPGAQPYASSVPVRHKEGSSHGFLVLRSAEGKLLATGDAIQTVKGDRVIGDLALHFKDGSLHEETTEFSQGSVFRVITDHLKQQGPSFPNPVDSRIEVATGQVRARGKDGKEQRSQLRLPGDLANGLLITILKNLPESDSETTVSLLTTAAKPRVVKFKIRRRGEAKFSAGGESGKATHFVGHTDIGGVAGVVAKVAGRQPPDVDFWIVEGKAPTFLKFLGPLYDEGPVWSIEQTAPKLSEEPAAKDDDRS